MSQRKKISPRDSWLQLAPGASVHLDERLAQIWNKKTHEFREVRGNILSACFEIEYTLDQILAEVFFPGLDKAPKENEQPSEPASEDALALKNLFDELFLKGNFVNFRTKIDLLRKLSSQIPTIKNLVPQDLVSRIDKVRDIRNRFAHYPVTFVPIGDIPNQDLAVHLDCRDETILLDQAFFSEYTDLFNSVGKDMSEIFKNLKEEVSRT